MCSAFLGGVIQGVDSVVRKFESLKIPPSSGATRILGFGPDISRMTPEVSFTIPKTGFAVVRRLGHGTCFHENSSSGCTDTRSCSFQVHLPLPHQDA